METRKLGRFQVPVVGLGCNEFGNRCDAEQSAAVVHAALDAGITLFDTADVYSSGLSEEYLGRALRDHVDEVVIATKFGGRMDNDPERGGGSPRWIGQAVNDSLRRLGTDHIDLYQMHTPDDEVPVEETLGALDELVTAGKVLEIGCSNFSGAQIHGAAETSTSRGFARFVSAQNRYSLITRDIEEDVVPACAQHGLGVLPYFPLESGLLTGKYTSGQAAPDARLAALPPERAERFLNERNLDVTRRLEAFAVARERTLLELAVSWLVEQPSVACVIAGATKPEQVRANVDAAGWRLDRDDLAEIDDITSRDRPT